jgi:hypothetical protein
MKSSAWRRFTRRLHARHRLRGVTSIARRHGMSHDSRHQPLGPSQIRQVVVPIYLSESSGIAGHRPHHAAPTLLGSQESHNHGAVQVWTPDDDRLAEQKTQYSRRLIVTAIGPAALALLCPWIVPRSASVPVLLVLLLLACTAYIFYTVARTLIIGMRLPEGPMDHRPRFVTTDSQGIAITTYNGSRAFLWSEIVGICWRPFSGQLRIRLNSGERASVILSAHSPEDQRALLEMIVSKCELPPDRARCRALPACDCISEPGRPEICERSMSYARRLSGSNLEGRALPEPGARLPPANWSLRPPVPDRRPAHSEDCAHE